MTTPTPTGRPAGRAVTGWRVVALSRGGAVGYESRARDQEEARRIAATWQAIGCPALAYPDNAAGREVMRVWMAQRGVRKARVPA